MGPPRASYHALCENGPDNAQTEGGFAMARKIGGYLRPAAAAQYLGIPVQEVQQMIESEELPRMKINGEWRVPVDQLEAWLDEEVSEAELKTLAQHIEDVDEGDVEEIVQEEGQDEASSSKGND